MKKLRNLLTVMAVFCIMFSFVVVAKADSVITVPVTVEKNFTKLKLSKKSFTYTGKSIKPKVTVYDGKKKLSSKYYKVTYNNNKNVGIAEVTVTGKGKYASYKSTATFKINLKKTSLTSVKSQKKNHLTVKWKKSAQHDGYEIQIASNKKFTVNVRRTTLSRQETSVKLDGMRSKKTYYVRIRTYKEVNGKIWYGAWSSVKKAKAK